MIARYSRFLLVLGLLMAAWPARAAFHLWALDEIYSSADGTVQYVELQALAGGQQFLAGHTLVAGTGPGARTFNFPSNLPGDTAGKRMLIGTNAFAAQGVVTPDYVVPNNFFDIPNGTLNFAESSDTWNYTGVPTSGPVALFRSGSSGERTPTNFAGATPNPPRLVNISTRAQVLTGDDVMIAGFVIGGPVAKTIVVRARGPSLTGQGVAGALANPTMQLFSGQVVLGTNDNWQAASNFADIQASGFAPSDPSESAIMMTLNPGAYTAIVSGVGQTTGIAIIEVFEVGGVELPLVNIATRTRVATGDNVMIAGFIIQGSGPQAVVVRARGPSLSSQGIAGALGNPTLQLFSGQTVIGANDNWQSASNSADIQASGFAPLDPQESAIFMVLAPGAYTAIVSGVGGTTGVAIIEVFKTTCTQNCVSFP